MIFKTCIRTSVFFAVQFTLSRSSPLVRNAKHFRTFCFLEVILPLEKFLSTNVSFCSSIYIEDSPKLPRGMHRICGPFVLKTIIMNYFAFRETLMSCATRSLDLLILFMFMFYTLDTSRPILALFTHFAYTNFFHMYITMRNIFLFSDDAVDQRKLAI